MRKIVPAMVLALLLLTALPSLFAEGEWQNAKTRMVDLGRTEYVSTAYSATMVSGDTLDLPGKDGQGIKVKVTNQKILVDKDQKGKPDLASGDLVTGERGQGSHEEQK
jgi:hypothetical protein